LAEIIIKIFLICRACAAIPRKTLLRIVQHFQKRVNLCLEANGGNFEHALL